MPGVRFRPEASPDALRGKPGPPGATGLPFDPTLIAQIVTVLNLLGFDPNDYEPDPQTLINLGGN